METKKEKPDYSVLLSTKEGEERQRIGSGWSRTAKNGLDYIYVQLGVWDKEEKKSNPVKLKGDEAIVLFKNKEPAGKKS